MNRRRAQAEGVGEIAEREPRVEREFQRDDEVLGVELHRTSIRSIFQNVEQSRQQAFFLGYFDLLAAAQRAHPNRVARSKKAELTRQFRSYASSMALVWHQSTCGPPAGLPGQSQDAETDAYERPRRACHLTPPQFLYQRS